MRTQYSMPEKIIPHLSFLRASSFPPSHPPSLLPLLSLPQCLPSFPTSTAEGMKAVEIDKCKQELQKLKGRILTEQ